MIPTRASLQVLICLRSFRAPVPYIVCFWACMAIVHSKKTDPWQPQLVGWYERRPLHDPNMVFAYRSKKKTTMFGAKTIVLSWYWVLFPAAALCVAAQSTSFLLLSIFMLHGCYFSGWGCPVDGYWFQKNQFSRSTTVTKRGRDVQGNPDALLQIDKERAYPKEHVCFHKKKKFRNFLSAHLGFFAVILWSLHRTSAVAVQSHRRLAFARRRWDCYMYDAHLQQMLACGWKGKTTAFRAKKGKLLSQVCSMDKSTGKEKTGLSLKTFEKSQIHLRDQFFWNGL